MVAEKRIVIGSKEANEVLKRDKERHAVGAGIPDYGKLPVRPKRDINGELIDYSDQVEADDDQDSILDMEESFDERAQVAAAQAAITDTVAPKDTGEHWLSLGSVRTDGGTQSRVRLDAGIVQDYAQQFTANAAITAVTRGLTSDRLWWGDFPALVVYLDGDYWLADGFHRAAGIEQALKQAGLPDSSIRNWRVRCQVVLGSKREAILHAAGANAVHGLRRTNADKRKAVETLLQDEEWRSWSDSAVAKVCKVDPKTVAGVREKLTSTMEFHSEMQRKTADGRVMDTTNIGRKPEPVNYSPAVVLENMVWEWVGKHSRETTHTPLAVLEFLDDGKTTRADKERRQLGAWLLQLGVTWRYDDLSQAIKHVRASRQQEANQAQGRVVYSDPVPVKPPEPLSPRQIINTLRTYPTDDQEFLDAVGLATIEQLTRALEGMGTEQDKKRFLKIGNRRELLLTARDAQIVDELIEAAMPTEQIEQAIAEATPAVEPKPDLTPDDLAAKGLAIVPSEDGKGWRTMQPLGEASAIRGPIYASIDDAIKHARRAILLIETYPAEMIHRGLKEIGKDKPQAAPSPAVIPDKSHLWQYSGGATIRVAGGGSLGMSMYGPFPDLAPESGEYEITFVLVRRIGKVAAEIAEKEQAE